MAALIPIAKRWKQPRSIDEKDPCNGCYSAMKRNKVLTGAIKGMNPEKFAK